MLNIEEDIFNGDQQLFGSSKWFCVQHKKGTYTSVDRHEGEKWQNVHFWVNYSFKILLAFVFHQRKPYRFGTMRVNDDRIFIFGLIIPLRISLTK